MIRILVVDDSAFMRKALSMMLEEDADVRVIDTARDGLEAIEKVKRLRPDLVTMDIEMPRMDGLTALKRIMQEHPVPVMMISSLTQEGARVTVEALQAGAVDFIPKQMSFVSLEITQIKAELLEKVKAVARTRSPLFRQARAAAGGVAEPGAGVHLPGAQMVVIGVSTGGPFALHQVIPKLPEDFPLPVAVVQHMPPHFTRSLAERLDAASVLRVAEAEAGMVAAPGTVLIAPGGRHLTLRKSPRGLIVGTPEEPSDLLHRPSVDVLFASAGAACSGPVLGVVMTGMGKDGLEGARQIRRHGGKILAQDEATCVVYGMPKAVAQAGLADAVLPLGALAPALTRAVRRSRRSAGSRPHAAKPLRADRVR